MIGELKILRGNAFTVVKNPLRATLTFDDEAFMVVNAEDVEVALQSCFKRFVVEDFSIDTEGAFSYDYRLRKLLNCY